MTPWPIVSDHIGGMTVSQRREIAAMLRIRQKIESLNRRINFMPVRWYLALSPFLHLTGAFFPAGEVV